MVSKETFLFIGCMWGIARCQILDTDRGVFINNVADVSSVYKVQFPSMFTGRHEHPVLTRMKYRGYKHVLPGKDKRNDMFGNFDPNAFNAQAGASFNPNAVNGGSGSSTGGMSMFNPNAMMGGGGSTTGGMSMFNPSAMMGGGGGTSGSGTGQTQQGGATQSGTSSGTGSSTGSGGSSGGSSLPHYDPNNVINTGAKYDPNAANSGMGAASGGSSPSFTNGMGMSAQQQMPPGTSAFGSSATGSGSSATGSGSSATGFGSSATGSGSSSSGSSSSTQSSGASSGSGASTFDPNTFGSSAGGGSSSGGSSSSAASAFGSSSGGSQPQTQTGSGSTSSGGGASQTGGAGQTGGASQTGSFDPVKTNSMATSGFNPLNPMLGKDMSQMMGPQSQTGSKGPGNFDPGAVNTQMGANGMSLNMFGGAGGNTALDKANASTLMGGAQGMMAGSSSVLGGGNAMLSGGGQTGGSSSGFGQTGGSSGFGSSSSSGGSSSGSGGMSMFDPNAMMGGGGSGSGGSSGSSSSGGMSMFNPSAMMGGGSGGGSSGSSSGGMNVFDPNAMMGGGSMNPMMPGGNMNPMMPGGSMTGSGSGSSTSGSRTSGSSPILDPLGAMSGAAKNFSGGSSLIDPMGFMNGGGLSGSMKNMFNPSGRSVPIVGSDRLRRDTAQLNWRHGNFFNTVTGQEYNPMDPMGFIFAGNKKQFSQGNGVDTPAYDPDKYSYAYAGVTFGSFPAIPSTGGAFIPSYPNFGHDGSTNGQESLNENKTSLPTQAVAGDHNGNASTSKAEGIIENFQHLLSNTQLYPHASYSGTPGMLGMGSQSHIPLPKFTAPSLETQYIDPAFKNISESALPYPSYSGLPGMQGVGSQISGTINSPNIAVLPDINAMKQNGYGQNLTAAELANPTAVYSGYPGMLGTGSMTGMSNGNTGEVMHNFGESRVNTGDSATDGRGQGYSNEETYNFGFNHVSASGGLPGSTSDSNSYGSLGMGAIQQTKVNNWNGDWPGEISQGGASNGRQDWSGAWSDSWPETTGPEHKPSEHKQSSSDFGNSKTSQSTANSWDGSWPGQERQTTGDSEKSSNRPSDNTETFGDTLEALKELISHLDNFPARVTESEQSPTRSYSDLVGDWNKELRHNR